MINVGYESIKDETCNRQGICYKGVVFYHEDGFTIDEEVFIRLDQFIASIAEHEIGHDFFMYWDGGFLVIY